MKVICAWCKKVMKEGTGDISHSICAKCHEIKMKELKALKEEK